MVAVPPPHVGGMYWIFVQLETACGISGVGEIYATSFHPTAMIPLIDDVFQRYLLDHDPHQIERQVGVRVRLQSVPKTVIMASKINDQRKF